MEQQSPAARAAGKVAEALRKTSEENHHLRTVLAPFTGLLVEQASWKAVLPAPGVAGSDTPDAERFNKGIPLASREKLIRLGALWKDAAERLVPPFAEGFGEIEGGLRRLQTAISSGSFDPDLYLGLMMKNDAGQAREMSEAIGLNPDVLQFALIQLAKPIVERRAEALQVLIGKLNWDRGYCPICGSLPELSLLKGKEGQRWLRCGFCACEWRFHRTTCPNCGTQEPDDLELCYIEGREHERLELCHKCKTYLVSVDIRNFADEIIPDVLRLGLLHLDAIAQGREFRPMNPTGWTKSPPAADATGQSNGRAPGSSGENTVH